MPGGCVDFFRDMHGLGVDSPQISHLILEAPHHDDSSANSEINTGPVPLGVKLGYYGAVIWG